MSYSSCKDDFTLLEWTATRYTFGLLSTDRILVVKDDLPSISNYCRWSLLDFSGFCRSSLCSNVSIYLFERYLRSRLASLQFLRMAVSKCEAVRWSTSPSPMSEH
jgi:hypothetical protein